MNLLGGMGYMGDCPRGGNSCQARIYFGRPWHVGHEVVLDGLGCLLSRVAVRHHLVVDDQIKPWLATDVGTTRAHHLKLQHRLLQVIGPARPSVLVWVVAHALHTV